MQYKIIQGTKPFLSYAGISIHPANNLFTITNRKIPQNTELQFRDTMQLVVLGKNNS